MKYSSSFTYDLHLGEHAEDWAKQLFGNAKIEIKADSMAHLTGNLFIEVYYRNKPSGISTTEADYWLFKFETGTAIVISTERLKQLVKKFFSINGFKEGGDDNMSKGVLIPLVYILI